MQTCKIKVFDYNGARYGSTINRINTYFDDPRVEFNPDAYCVGGAEGVRAYWIDDGWLYTAHGDDGHWWLDSRIGAQWLLEIKDVLTHLDSLSPK